MRGSVQNAPLLGRELAPELIGIDQLIALFGRKAAHATDRPVYCLPPIGWQLPKLLKYSARTLLLILRQVFPGLHAIEHTLLLLWRQTREKLQPSLQALLLDGWKSAELRIVFERSALLCRR